MVFDFDNTKTARVIDIPHIPIDSLLSSTSSDGRKLWGFELFRLSISRVPASDLPRMFTPNFLRSWVNHLAKPDRYLHKAAKLVVRDRQISCILRLNFFALGIVVASRHYSHAFGRGSSTFATPANPWSL